MTVTQSVRPDAPKLDRLGACRNSRTTDANMSVSPALGVKIGFGRIAHSCDAG